MMQASRMPLLLLLGGLTPLLVAWVAQYAFNLPPCEFCLLQRWPYALPILGAALAYYSATGSLRWRFGVAIGIMGWLATGVLGLAHSGIETGFLKYTGGCVASADTSIESILASPLVSCDAVMAEWFGLSMASWNSLFAFAMVALAFALHRSICRNV